MTTVEILNELNRGLPTQEWSEVISAHAFPTVDFPESIPRRVSVNVSAVMVVKTFLNSRTGEVRAFLAKSINDFNERSLL